MTRLQLNNCALFPQPDILHRKGLAFGSFSTSSMTSILDPLVESLLARVAQLLPQGTLPVLVPLLPNCPSKLPKPLNYPCHLTARHLGATFDDHRQEGETVGGYTLNYGDKSSLPPQLLGSSLPLEQKLGTLDRLKCSKVRPSCLCS